MNLKYAIKIKKTNKWFSLDFHDGSEIIYVDKFTSAYHFDSQKETEKFLKNNNIEKDSCELFKLKVFAEPQTWSSKK